MLTKVRSSGVFREGGDEMVVNSESLSPSVLKVGQRMNGCGGVK